MTFSARITIPILVSFIAGAAVSSEQSDIPVLYPKDNSIVGTRVNVVIDPAHDWSGTAFFQVSTDGYRSDFIDPSTGRHAVQGIALEPGINKITIKTFAAADEKKNLTQTSARQITVYSAGLSPFIPAPKDFSSEPFHSKEQEEVCSGCHRMDAGPDDAAHLRAEDVLCYTCHRNVPTGDYIHGPAAVWNCLACHNPDLEPYKYQFVSYDPWKVTKTTMPVEPMSFTFQADALFKRGTAVLSISKKKAGEIFRDLIEYAMHNQTDRIRIEAHTDNRPVKSKVFKNNNMLTAARAQAIAGLLKAYKISPKRITAVGMGSRLPKVPNTTKESRELNNRIEIVVHPKDVKIKNSRNLPVLKDREKVAISISYSRGPSVKGLKIIERLPESFQYLKGSGYFAGLSKEPVVKKGELVWSIGDRSGDFNETLFYVLKKTSKDDVPHDTSISYKEGKKELRRVFDPLSPGRAGLTLLETCSKCHQDMFSGAFRHGPADAGLCTICHNPHASPNPAWTRKKTWDLCVTCHAEKASGRHVVAGFVSGETHPTKDRRDPARPGKYMSCTSCHNPHAGQSRELYAAGIKTRSELCSMCHRRF